MNVVISKLGAKILSTEEDKHKTAKYLQMQQTDGWKVHLEFLLYMRGLMAEDMLSDRFTSLTAYEKDVSQRAYAMAEQIVQFLIDPLSRARKLAAMTRHNQKMEATMKGSDRRKE